MRPYLICAVALIASAPAVAAISAPITDVVIAAPEPATWMTMILGSALLGVVLRRRRRARRA